MRYSTTCNKHSNFSIHYVLGFCILYFYLYNTFNVVIKKVSFKAHAHIVRGSAFTVAISRDRPLRRCRRRRTVVSRFFPFSFQGRDRSAISSLFRLSQICTVINREMRPGLGIGCPEKSQKHRSPSSSDDPRDHWTTTVNGPTNEEYFCEWQSQF